ncbi:MAG: hypothetical protein J4F36_12410 [Nitrosopumilaceae archaeon]|nr:hypothetical protein [Nitrosopumilaceae archaeon]
MNQKILLSIVILMPIIALISYVYVDSVCDEFTKFGECVNLEEKRERAIQNSITEPFGITLEEFNDLESKVIDSNHKKIIPVLVHNNGDIEKTISMLNFNK